MIPSRALASLALLPILLGRCRTTGSPGSGRGRPGADIDAAIRKAEEVGRALYFLDRAATIAAEAVEKHVGAPADLGIFTKEEPPRIANWPLETHVLASITHRDTPLYVITRLGQWSLVRGHIEFMGPVR